jgi:dTDP-glucose 4,6-dehydratase
MKKVALITGCSGFIGSHALEYYLENTDWDIICPNSWRHKGTPERITEVIEGYEDRVTVLTHDLTVPFTDITIKRLPKIDYIINFASESHVNRSITEPAPFILNNVNLLLTMLELARVVKPEVFIQVSTDEVYGSAPEGVRFPEWSEIIPSNPYAGSKCAQEAIAISYWRTYGVPLIITNTVNNFGERQDTEKYLALLIKKIEAGEKVSVHGTKEYNGARFYLHAKNHASAIKHMIDTNQVKLYEDGKVKQPQRFNITSDDEISNIDMAKLVAEIMDKPLDYEFTDYHASRPGHDRRYGLDGSKLKETGWELEFPLKTSLSDYISWTLQNKHWL